MTTQTHEEEKFKVVKPLYLALVVDIMPPPRRRMCKNIIKKRETQKEEK